MVQRISLCEIGERVRQGERRGGGYVRGGEWWSATGIHSARGGKVECGSGKDWDRDCDRDRGRDWDRDCDRDRDWDWDRDRDRVRDRRRGVGISLE